jgi:hypothetical protein
MYFGYCNQILLVANECIVDVVSVLFYFLKIFIIYKNVLKGVILILSYLN